jgi:hypothetical protein
VGGSRDAEMSGLGRREGNLSKQGVLIKKRRVPVERAEYKRNCKLLNTTRLGGVEERCAVAKLELLAVGEKRRLEEGLKKL